MKKSTLILTIPSKSEKIYPTVKKYGVSNYHTFINNAGILKINHNIPAFIIYEK